MRLIGWSHFYVETCYVAFRFTNIDLIYVFMPREELNRYLYELLKFTFSFYMI